MFPFISALTSSAKQCSIQLCRLICMYVHTYFIETLIHVPHLRVAHLSPLSPTSCLLPHSSSQWYSVLSYLHTCTQVATLFTICSLSHLSTSPPFPPPPHLPTAMKHDFKQKQDRYPNDAYAGYHLSLSMPSHPMHRGFQQRESNLLTQDKPASHLVCAQTRTNTYLAWRVIGCGVVNGCAYVHRRLPAHWVSQARGVVEGVWQLWKTTHASTHLHTCTLPWYSLSNRRCLGGLGVV